MLRHQEARQLFRLRDCSGKTYGAQLRRDAPKAREVEREQVAALGGDQRMQFIEHDALE
jgi:hypothetical protein